MLQLVCNKLCWTLEGRVVPDDFLAFGCNRCQFELILVDRRVRQQPRRRALPGGFPRLLTAMAC